MKKKDFLLKYHILCTHRNACCEPSIGVCNLATSQCYITVEYRESFIIKYLLVCDGVRLLFLRCNLKMSVVGRSFCTKRRKLGANEYTSHSEWRAFTHHNIGIWVWTIRIIPFILTTTTTIYHTYKMYTSIWACYVCMDMVHVQLIRSMCIVQVGKKNLFKSINYLTWMQAIFVEWKYC